MSELIWDKPGERLYETGVDHGVLYVMGVNGVYEIGVAWNGLVTVTESPSGAEASPQYADNIKYLNLTSAEEFGGTIEAFTYPEKFELCDGTAQLAPGISVSQQSRRTFGLSYRTLVGNDIVGTDFGEKLHIVYGALAAPSEKARSTVNDSPEAVTFSWEFNTTPVAVKDRKPTAHVVIDSAKTDPAVYARIKEALYGTDSTDAHILLPDEIIELAGGGAQLVTPVEPTQNGSEVVIPDVTGVVYKVDGVVSTGTITITDETVVTAEPASGYTFPPTATKEWTLHP